MDRVTRGASSEDDLADPRRDTRHGALVAILFFVIFGGWAMVAHLDAAIYAAGTLVVTGQRQTVQYRDGGVVQRIMVREGEQVKQGQLLVSFVTSEVAAQERGLASQYIQLLAQRARLEAEQSGSSHVSEPTEYSALPERDKGIAVAAIRRQRAELEVRRATLVAQNKVLHERAKQAALQADGYDVQAVSARKQLDLINQQLEALELVAKRGFVPQTRLRELERLRAELQGRQGQYSASVIQMRAAVGENRYQQLEADHTFQERSATEWRDTQNRLEELLPRLAAARTQLERADVRAPVAGRVTGLAIFTPGGVVAPGQKLLDVVPDKAALRVQLRINPDDADDIAEGQIALIRFASLHDRSLPDIAGRLTRLSADSFTDDKTGQSFYTGDVDVPSSSYAALRDREGHAYMLRAGMPVQVLMTVRRRTVLDYALEPLTGAFWGALRER